MSCGYNMTAGAPHHLPRPSQHLLVVTLLWWVELAIPDMCYMDGTVCIAVK